MGLYYSKTKIIHCNPFKFEFMETFENDTRTINVNGTQVEMRMYNLIVCVPAVRLYTKGIKPNRNFSINEVKKYFGLKGNAQSVLSQLEELKEKHIPK